MAGRFVPPGSRQHLASLREDHRVNARGEAPTIYYSLAHGPAPCIIDTIHGIHCAAGRANCE